MKVKQFTNSKGNTVKNPKRMRQMWVRTQRSIGVNHD